MGYILLSLVVGVILLFLSVITGRIESNKWKFFKIIICIISVGCLFGFINRIFIGTDSLINTLVLIIGILGCLIFPFSVSYNKDVIKQFVTLTVGAIIIVGVILGFGAGSGYEDEVKEVNSIELTECKFEYGENEYSYYLYEEEYNYVYLDFNSKTNKFEEIKISKKEAKIDENDIYTQPKLVIYERKAKQTFWSFGLSKKTEYVFYVPNDAISEDIFP